MNYIHVYVHTQCAIHLYDIFLLTDGRSGLEGQPLGLINDPLIDVLWLCHHDHMTLS